MAVPDFALQKHLDHLYQTQPRRLELRAKTAAEFVIWRDSLRAEVKKVLGIAGRDRPRQPQARKLQSFQREGYAEEKWALEIGERVTVPVYLLIPEVSPPYRPVLVFHGHNVSAQYMLGNYPDEEQAKQYIAKDNNYAQALAQAGFFVCAVEQRSFGERTSDNYGKEGEIHCRHQSLYYQLLGRTMIGERCWDGMCALDFVQTTRDDLRPGGFGCTGNSGGGTTTLWLSALDERIAVSVPSCYFCSFKNSIASIWHCACNYVPGILQLCEMGELGAAIAPRPLQVIAGEQDDIFPIEAVREQFETVKRAYALAGAKEKCSLAVHPQGHRYSHALSHEWFRQWL